MLILDTDIASAFAKAGHFDVLIHLLGKVGITPMVYEELQTPLMHGYAYPDEIFNKAELVTILEEEQRDYLNVLRAELSCTHYRLIMQNDDYIEHSSWLLNLAAYREMVR